MINYIIRVIVASLLLVSLSATTQILLKFIKVTPITIDIKRN